ncbi:MAG: hypothetical protein KY455_11210 [Euryarchaeota archaeon]|nr:hypothetical protein [Euryarchaeota archaeon]
MFETIRRGWGLTKLSFSVIKQDKELMLFPVFSGIVMVVLMASFGGFGWWMDHTTGLNDQAALALGLVFYFLSYLVVIYFNTGVVFAARIRLDGGDPTLKDGFRGANSRLPQIFGWALIAATVGLILQILQRMARDRNNLIGQILAGLAGMAWNLMTYFVLPIIAAEGLGPIDSIKKSASVFKRTWGESIVGGLGIGLIFFLLGVLGVIPLFIAYSIGNATLLIAVFALVVLYWVFLAILNSTASQVLVATLYRYATKGETGGVMPPDAAQHIFDRQQNWDRYTEPSGRIRNA